MTNKTIRILVTLMQDPLVHQMSQSKRQCERLLFYVL